MTEIEEPVFDTDSDGEIHTPVGGLNREGGNSVIDLLRQDMADIAANRDVYIPVKGYEKTGLAIRYGLPEKGKDLDVIVEKVSRDNKDDFYRNLYIAMDTMIFLCLGIYVRPTEAELDDYVELDPQEHGRPVRFDGRMAEIVGLTPDAKARQIVKKLFDNNDMKILDHASRLQRWLTDTKADVKAELWQLGN